MVTCIQKISELHRFQKKTISISSAKKFDHRSSLLSEHQECKLRVVIQQDGVIKADCGFCIYLLVDVSLRSVKIIRVVRLVKVEML